MKEISQNLKDYMKQQKVDNLTKLFQKICFNDNTSNLLEDILAISEVKNNEHLLEKGMSWVVCSLNDKEEEKIIKIKQILPLISNANINVDFFFSTLILSKEQYEVFSVLLLNETFFKNTKKKLENNKLINILQNKRNKRLDTKRFLNYLEEKRLLPIIEKKDIPEELKDILYLYLIKTKIKRF